MRRRTQVPCQEAAALSSEDQHARHHRHTDHQARPQCRVRDGDKGAAGQGLGRRAEQQALCAAQDGRPERLCHARALRRPGRDRRSPRDAALQGTRPQARRLLCQAARSAGDAGSLKRPIMDGVLHRHTQPGTSPGPLAGRAPVPDEALDFTLVEYTQEDVQILHNVEVDECRFHLGTPGRTWIDVAGRPSSDMLRDLGMAFNLHPLALEDVFHGNQRAKLDLYDGQGFIVLNDPSYKDGEINLRQVSIFFGENYVISFHDHKLDVFKPVRDRVQTSGSRLRMFGIDYLVYALVDLVVDRKFPLIETLSTHLEELEDEAL